MGGALVRLGHSLVRVKIWGRSTPRGRNMFLRKMRFRWVRVHSHPWQSRVYYTAVHWCTALCSHRLHVTSTRTVTAAAHGHVVRRSMPLIRPPVIALTPDLSNSGRTLRPQSAHSYAVDTQLSLHVNLFHCFQI